MSAKGATVEASQPVEHDATASTSSSKRLRITNAKVGIVFAALWGALLPQFWFRPGKFIAAGDNGPFLGGLEGVFGSWTTALTGTGSSGYRNTALLEDTLHWAITGIGLSSPDAQRLWYTLVVAAAAAAVAWFAAQFVRYWPSVLAAGVVAVTNPFHIVTLPNVLPLVTIAVLGVLGAVTMRMSRGTRAPWWTPIALAAGVSIVVRNPPLLVLVAVSGVGCAAYIAAKQRKAMLSHLGWIVAATVACSLFWIVAVVTHFGLGTPGIEVVATTDVDSWSWTQRNSGISNVSTLVASWVWGDPDVLSATANLATPWWSWLRFGLPILAFSAVLLSSRRRIAVTFSVAAAVLIALSVGVNSPFGTVNDLLVDYVPGFWLYRQPMSKFGTLLIVCYSVLAALTVDGITDRFRARPITSSTRVAAGVVGVAAVFTVVYPYPLYDGSVIPGDRSYLPASSVELPSDFVALGKWLDNAEQDGSVLVLPLSEYYQRGTTWGYYGVDDLISRVTDRPALFRLPGGYYAAAGSADALMVAAETALLLGDEASFARAAEALGVSYVTIRDDHTTSWGQSRRWTSSTDLTTQADRLLTRAATFDNAVVFEAPGSRTSLTDMSVNVASTEDGVAMSDIVTASAVGTTILSNPVIKSSAMAWRPSLTDQSTEVDVSTAGTLTMAAHTTPLWEMETTGGEHRVRPIGGVSADDTQLEFDWRTIDIGGTPQGYVVDGRPVAAAPRLTFTGAPEVEVVALYKSGPTSAPGRCLTPEGLCSSFQLEDTATVSGLRIWSAEIAGPGVSSACVWSLADEACVSSTVSTAEGGKIDGLVVVEDDRSEDLEYRVFGATASVTSGGIVPLEAAAGEAVIGDVPAVKLEMDDPDSLTALGDAYLENRLERIEPVAADCHDFDDGPDVGLSATEDDGVIELSARRHSACVNAAFDVSDGAEHFTVSFDYMNISGKRARWCILDAQTEGCAATGTLPLTEDWASFTQTFQLPERAVTDIASQAPPRLYLYADGAGPGEAAATTTVAYRKVGVNATYPYSVTFVSDPYQGPERIVYRTGFAAGWQAAGADQFSHVLADGWANSWVVSSDGNAVTFSYRWDRYVFAATVVSAAAVLALAGYALTKDRRQRRRK